MSSFYFYRGDSQTFKLSFTDKEDNSIDISDWTIYFTLKRTTNESDDDAPIKKDITEHTNPVNGKTSFELTSNETNDLLGQYYYDIQYKDSSGNIKTVDEGNMVFSPDITRRT